MDLLFRIVLIGIMTFNLTGSPAASIARLIPKNGDSRPAAAPQSTSNPFGIRFSSQGNLPLLSLDPPVANEDTYPSIAEDTQLVVSPEAGVLINDTDPESDPLTAEVFNAPDHGDLVLHSDGSFIYTPDADYNGSDSFQYHAFDSTSYSPPATVYLTITPVNDAPVASNQSVTTDEDVATAVILTATDVDLPAQTLTYTIQTPPVNGTLTGTAPNLIYTPNLNYNGSDSFTFIADDGLDNSLVAAVTLTINPVNDIPDAPDQNVTTKEDVAVAVPLAATDVDLPAQSLTYTIQTLPVNGTLTGTAPNLTYTPSSNYHGSDSFTYVAKDGVDDSRLATVSLTITPVNDLPVAADQSITTDEDVPVAITLTATDVDLPAQTLTFHILTSPGSGTLTGTAPNLTYTPNSNFNGSDSFTFVAFDGLDNSLPATVSLTLTPINDPPVAVNDSYSVTENVTRTVLAPGVLSNDSDVDSLVLTAELVSGPSKGILTLNPSGGFTYVPNPYANGTDSFTYRAKDGTLYSEAATVTLTIQVVNYLPVAQPDAYTTAEDTSLVVPAPGLKANDTDPDPEDVLTPILVSGPLHGTLTPQLLAADGSFTYTPDKDYNGSDAFTYYVNDGTRNSDTVTVSLSITPVNDIPVAADQSITAEEDVVVAVTLTATDVDLPAQTLTFHILTSPGSGTLTGTAPNLTYTPNSNFNGSDSFTFVAYDGVDHSLPATVSLTLTPVNDPPVAINDSYSVAENVTRTVLAPGVLGNDTDVDSPVLTAELVSGPTKGTLTLDPSGGFTYVPNPYANGTDSFTYRAKDGTLYSEAATVTLTIQVVNYLPVAQPDAYTTSEDTPLVVPAPGLKANDTDPDPEDVLTPVLGSGPQHGLLSPLALDGSFTYTPDKDYYGSDAFTYYVNDGTVNSDPVTVSLTITSVNDIPVAGNQSVTTDEDVAKAITLTATDVDLPAQTLTYTIQTPPAHGKLSGTAPALTYTPDLNYNGPDSFTFTAFDGIDHSLPATVNITVTPVNDAPVAVNDSYAVTENVTRTVLAPGVLSNDSDVDSLVLTAELVSGPTKGTLTLDLSGGFTYTPNPYANGADSFTYRTKDGDLYSQTATVTLSITAVNYLPVAQPDAYTTAEDTPLVVPAPGLKTNDTDPDPEDVLTPVLVSGPLHGLLSPLAIDGSFTYTPDKDYNGSDAFTYYVNDGTGSSNTVTVSLTITPVNDLPVAASQNLTTDEDVPVAITLTATDIDLPKQTLTYIVQTPPSHGTLSGTPPALTYTPELNYNGPDSFTFIAFDGMENSLPATVSLTLTPVNDAPVANIQSVITDEDVAKAITLTATDVDLPAQALTYTIQTQPAHGTLTGTVPNLIYTPNLNYNGGDFFTFITNDGLLNSLPATVNLTLAPVNDAPFTYNKPCVVTPTGPDEEAKQYYSVDQDGFLDVPLEEGVLVCDYDVDVDGQGHPETFTAVLKTSPSKGTVTLNPDGSFHYETKFGKNGDDAFTYRAFDGKDYSRETTVRLHIDLTTYYRVEWVAPKGIYMQYQVADPDPLKPPKTVRLNRFDVGKETVLLKVNVYKVKDAKSNITNEVRDSCPECANMGIRFFRWDAPAGSYKPITLLPAGARTYAYDTTELNSGWNEIQAVAVYNNSLVDNQNSGDASNRSEITTYLWRHNYSGPIKKLFLPVSTR